MSGAKHITRPLTMARALEQLPSLQTHNIYALVSHRYEYCLFDDH